MSRAFRFLISAAVLAAACIFSVFASTTSLALFQTAQNCTKTEFTCRVDGRCIPLIKWQDGIEDCLDASDEECLPWQFDCKYGKPKCISSRQVKDGVIDCMSGFDEGCPSHYFVCNDKSACIDISKYLDRRPDCRDGSDEPCGPDQFFCHDRSGCVPLLKFQDGHRDCADGSDEECTQNQYECPCGFPGCISTFHVGDGRNHCADGADERVSGTKSPKKCPDGSKPRAGGISTALVPSEMVLCHPNNNTCLEELGQICVVVGGASRCVCKMGTVKPDGSPKCIPVDLLPEYFRNPLANCSATREDLNKLYQIPTPKPFPEEFALTWDKKKNNSDANIPPRPEPKEPGLRIGKIGQNRDEPLRRYPPATKLSNPSLSLDSSKEDDWLVQVNPSDKGFEEPEKLMDLCDPKNKRTCPEKGEICKKGKEGIYKCECAGTKVDGKCLVLVNECEDVKLNDCHEHAICIDNVHSYECFCKEGYVDMSESPTVRPGMKCKKLVNECKSPFWNDCDRSARCIDKPTGFTCQCRPGFLDISEGGASNPGRKCLKSEFDFLSCHSRVPVTNECLDGTHKCDPNAICEDLPYGYRCKCAPGFVDASSDSKKMGRVCHQRKI
ncbi:hypothetical protein L596_018023 [Steinernema carpocapsae]|uniref:EGF-like domain-containing protein n=1 Tax=Steinernema carpocapsae TaxID=34508 RepID=A0A4U5N3E6_STECR|nr:hypothetical protein L596_018023 [Steinernema carpocapsae]